ncbi:MAG TPA: hypothetical protein DCO71_09765 [Gammaproteobacteria bacterium]|nr:hypothetical protein [Gammaproteobacteria bacterium]
MFNQVCLTGQVPAFSGAGASRRLAVVLLLALACSFPVQVAASDSGIFQLEDAHTWRTGGNDYLGAQFDIKLSSGAEEAVMNGVPLVFEFQVQVVKTHTWIWDTVDIEINLYRQLQFHALSKSYLVKDISTGTQGNYHRLEDALRAAGKIHNLSMSDQALEPELNYEIRLRGSLDIESLPTPVRLIAYVSSAWDMVSKWHSWPLVR